MPTNNPIYVELFLLPLPFDRAVLDARLKERPFALPPFQTTSRNHVSRNDQIAFRRLYDYI